jgi:hypothetical protein
LEKVDERKNMKTITNIIYAGLAALVLGCFTLSPTAQAVTPAPDGGYPGGNTAEGDDALFSLTTGQENTAMGFEALYSNTETVHNTAIGYQALSQNTQDDNTGIGWHALFGNSTGYGNTACGVDVLGLNSAGSFNTATGFTALLHNNADYNTADGVQALYSNTEGFENTAVGAYALYSNTTGSYNTATGFHALISNATGDFNTANGESALASNTTACCNAAFGEDALASNIDGNWNTATGTNALISSNGQFNTANGAGALFNNTTGNNNIALGWVAGSNLTTGAYNIDIGNKGVAGESKTIRIGDVVATPYPDGTHPAHTAIYIAGIMGRTSSRGTPVFINANGQLGTATSSARFKDEIKPMDKASEAILALKPVTFHYKKELDPEGVPQFGLVAEEVEKVNPDLVVRDAEGKVYSVRYDVVNAMLLNEFLKEHRTVQEQQKEIDALSAELKEQRTVIQKVNDKVDLNRPAPQTVLNDQ